MKANRLPILIALIPAVILLVTSCSPDSAPGQADPLPPVSIEPEQTPAIEDLEWDIHIDDGFDSELTVPNAGFSYNINTHIVLDAKKKGGETAEGEYTGTLTIETSIDEESFIEAMKKMGAEDITGMDSYVDIKTADIKFSVAPYNHDEFNSANNAFKPAGIPSMVVPLVQPQGMAITSYTPAASQSVSVTAEKGFGFGFGSGGEEMPLLIKIGSDGAVTAYFPKMLQFGMRNYFMGELTDTPIG
jgi:hypothetical protein